MKLSEIQCLNLFFDKLEVLMGQAMDNDFELKNTSENFELVQNAIRFNSKNNELDFSKEILPYEKYNQKDLLGEFMFTTIFVPDFILLEYLRHVLDNSIVKES